MASRVICLDPGHGGQDPGATGASGTPEKTYNLAVALKAKEALVAKGYAVVMTRDADETVPNDQRVPKAKAAGAVAFVSIHHNAASSREAVGTEVLYPAGDARSLRLAQVVYDQLIAALGTKPRGVKARSDLLVLNAAKRAGLPACLVEVAFISNPDEERKAASPDFQAAAARAIADGVDRFFAAK